MIDKKTIEVLIDKYKRLKSEACKTTDTDADLTYALCEIFDKLMIELCIKSGLLPFEKFLQSRLDDTSVFRLSDSTFEIVVNFGDLIDESKTATYLIEDFQFVVKEAISSQKSVTEYDLKIAVATYNKIKE